METELISTIKYLTEELSNLSTEVKKLRKVNAEIAEKLYLTNEYLSTLNR